ncbi:PqqD family peptide modification chaperone [bacterium]|nr:PqqD family peptide modification chaperone [bacterium]
MKSVKLNENVAVSENGFVFNAQKGDSFSTNDTGKIIIGMLQKGHDTDEILAELLQQFNIDGPTLEKDLYDFLKTLEQLNLLSL